MANSLNQIFPTTNRQLTEEKFFELESEFLESFKIPRDVGFFPMLLKQKSFPESLIQVADFEYLQWQVAESEEISLRSGGAYALNSTLQWLILESGAAILNKPKGLYAFWKYRGQIFERALSFEEAEKIQGIQEHPELMAFEPENPVLDHLLILGMIKQISSGS